jgi:Ca2+/H+ antiporter, TMEM165/GDT1 family
MVAADALAIAVGRLLGRNLPERVVTLGAAALFFVFGVWLLVEAVAQLGGAAAVAAVVGHPVLWIALGVVVLESGAAVLGLRRRHRTAVQKRG